jgi:SAM-dependent methyltransferase
MTEIQPLLDDTRMAADPAAAGWTAARLDAIRRNRFLPEPPPEHVYVGDGDYRAIGAEFLGHFVRLGGLRPSDRVLDIGCGIGRMAVPLTQYLDPEAGSYEGFDPVAAGIVWCARTVTPVYPAFRFQHLDIAHALYNPGGCLPGTELQLPLRPESIDFALMVSVATHLPEAEIAIYAREVARVLAPGGRLFLTAFLAEADRPGAATLRFAPWAEGGWIANEAAPLAAIGFPRATIARILEEAGLAVQLVSPGHWAGEPSDHFQDIVVAAKPGPAR